MKRESLFEQFYNNPSGDIVAARAIKSKRGARLTLEHLLKLRNIREKKKLRRLKDIKLYNVMYNSDDGGGDMGGGF